MAKLAKTQMYVAGEWLIPSTGEYFESFNPYTGKPWMLVARGGVEDAHRAVEAAHNAFENPEWREMTPSARGQLLRRFGDLIGDNAERLAKIEVQDNVRQYIVDLVRATRESERVTLGASPRASISLYRASQARAAIHGRDFVIPDDVKALSEPVLAHRVIPNSGARLRGHSQSSIVEEVMETVLVPIEKS